MSTRPTARTRRSSLGPLALTAAATALAVAVPAQAGAAAARPLISAHISISAVEGALPAGATISVVQSCPAGSRLDRAATRSTLLEADKTLDPRLRASREYWVAGTVTRYRVARATTATTPPAVAGAVLCTSSVATTDKTASGRASTDLRVWGPAPSSLVLANGTAAIVTDDNDAADYAFATVMRAGGVASSKGSLTGALTAVQEVTQEEGIGAVAAVGETSRRVRRGSFVSMLNSYSYVSDLAKKATTIDG